MQGDRVEPFLDNWTYLKVELNWLERLLLLAVIRQRKETKEIDRIAQTKADRATSHWWKGMVNLEGITAYDSPPERKAGGSEKSSYQQQIEARIRASQKHGIELALPSVCDRLQLTAFEKNLILLGLAPEVHRRYPQLYGYLQGNKDSGERHELPNVDLALRLFCRTDADWRAARSRLIDSSPLIEHQLIELQSQQNVPLLNRTINLSDRFVNYLLSDRPTLGELERLVGGHDRVATCEPLASFIQSPPTTHFPDLVLPESLLDTLRHLCDRIQFCAQVDEEWGFQRHGELPGVVALMVGASGTGKTIAVRTIAATLNVPFVQIDLAFLNAQEQADLIQKVIAQAPTVLMIQSAERWLGRSASLPATQIARFLQQRRSDRCLTFLSVQMLPAIPGGCRSQLQHTLIFPHPNAALQLRLWQQAFPPQVLLDPEIDWDELAKKYPLTGGEIVAIARSAAFYAAAEGSLQIRMKHILKAYQAKR